MNGVAASPTTSEGSTDDPRHPLGLEGDDERAQRLRPLVAQLLSLDRDDLAWVLCRSMSIIADEDVLWLLRQLIVTRYPQGTQFTSTGVPAPPSSSRPRVTPMETSAGPAIT